MTKIKEEWRRVEGYPYEVSSIGRAGHISRRQIRKLKTCKNGYILLSVTNGRGSSKNLSMARLVCAAFNGPPTNTDVDHINRVRADNRPDNLRWVSRAENLKHRQPACGTDNANSKLNEEIVKKIRSQGKARGQDGILAKLYGVSRETVRDVRLNKLWRHVNEQPPSSWRQ